MYFAIIENDKIAVAYDNLCVCMQALEDEENLDEYRAYKSDMYVAPKRRVQLLTEEEYLAHQAERIAWFESIKSEMVSYEDIPF